METEANITGILILSGSFLFHSPGLIVDIALMLFLLFMSALLSGADVALSNAAPIVRSRSELLLTPKLLLIHKWIDNPSFLQSALKVTGFFFKFLFILVVTQNAILVLFPLGSNKILFLVFIFCFTIVYLLLIEVIPKSFAEAFPEKYSLFTVYFLLVVFLLFSPLIKLTIVLHTFFLRRALKYSDKIFFFEKWNATGNNGEVFTDEEEMVKGIAKFGNIDVSQIFRPRGDVVSLDYSSTLQEIVKVILESGYSRIPVYDNDFDNMKGVLFVKDLLPYIYSNDNFIWQSFIRPPYFIPESKKVIELLNEFKVNKIHMAIVVDEYGCTLGIVTLEDVLEEIVGEISDESDDDDNFYSKLSEDTYIFEAKISLNDFCKVFQLEPGFFDLIKGDADTLAGLILQLKGKIPLLYEEIRYKQFVFKMEAVDSRRIKQIKVMIINDFSNNDASL